MRRSRSRICRDMPELFEIDFAEKTKETMKKKGTAIPRMGFMTVSPGPAEKQWQQTTRKLNRIRPKQIPRFVSDVFMENGIFLTFSSPR